ncbi:efflux RND transporter permease subunit, partial [Staphylococcus aureus]|uniref:efflux RND transporter permease subunit n=1 Tax=Staphylococcus aureus TaxID=1280 RepID=UPI00123E6AD8
IYDRSGLIALTTRTVIHNMIEGILLIFFLQWLFLGNLRSALIVAATIPFALCFAVLILTLQGESANLLSVGALDFGLIVDATVVMVENIYRHLVARSHAVEHGAGHYTPGSRLSTILSAASEVNRGIFFAAAIIIASGSTITVKAGCWGVLVPMGAPPFPSGEGMRTRSCAKAGVAIRAARTSNRRMRILPIRDEEQCRAGTQAAIYGEGGALCHRPGRHPR